MDEYSEIKEELKEINPGYDFAKTVVFPLYERVRRAFYLNKLSEVISWDEAFKISWVWGKILDHEEEIRPILAEIRELVG